MKISFKNACRLAVFSVFPGLMVYFSLVNLHPKEARAEAPQTVLYPYHTIPIAGDDMLSYVLNRVDDKTVKYSQFSAVVQSLDPAKGNLKSCCEAVVSDVEEVADSDEIMVYVFDSMEASKLYEAYAQQAKVLTDEEELLMNQHLVAVYYGDVNHYEIANHTISFGTGAGKAASENETYEPRKYYHKLG